MKRCPICKGHYQGDPKRCPLDNAELEPIPAAQLGSEINGWLLAEAIAEGPLATVYRAERGSLCGALKLYKQSAPVDFRRTLREGLIQSRLHHPRLAHLLDQGSTPAGEVFLVTEYLAGHTLRALLHVNAPQPLPWSEAIAIAIQIAEGLEVIHEGGLVHRDLKPENLIVAHIGGSLDQGLDVKLLDLGHALLVDMERLTQSGLVWGSAPYMSPEQVSGLPLDGRSDLYSLGVILYEMLTGRRPFEAKAAVDIMQMQRCAVPLPPERLVDIPLVVNDMCLWLLCKQPRQRPLSARIAREALQGLISETRPKSDRAREGAQASV